jgi:hypothetical protein
LVIKFQSSKAQRRNKVRGQSSGMEDRGIKNFLMKIFPGTRKRFILHGVGTSFRTSGKETDVR